MRIRTIKPEWLEDEKLLDAGIEARLLSIALILLADDYGNGRVHAKSMASRIFPNSQEFFQKNIEVFENSLKALEKINFIFLYQVNGESFYHITNWQKHQKIDKPGKPHVPQPTENDYKNNNLDDSRNFLEIFSENFKKFAPGPMDLRTYGSKDQGPMDQRNIPDLTNTKSIASKEDDPNSNSQPPSKPKKQDPSLEKKKKRLAEAKEKAKGRLKNNSLPTPDLSQSKDELFAADEANRNTMLTILDSKKKAFTQKKKKLEADLHEEFLRVYCAEKYRETGNGLPPDGKHIQPACIKLSRYCLEQNIRPEKYIGYWVENNFTNLDFPTMTFLSGDKQIEAANIAFSKTNGKSRKNRKKQKEEYGHSFTGELDRGFRDALRSGGFDKALKMTDRELMTYQVAARHEKEQPGDLGMSDSMKEIVDYLVENFYN